VNRMTWMNTTMFILLLLSCSNTVQEKGAQKILKSSKGGDFRGVNIGDKPSDVVGREEVNSVYSMPDELVYRMESDGEDSTWYEISYNFNEAGLYNIKLEVFPKNEMHLKLFKDDFVRYYKEKYGDCKYNNGYCEWRAMTTNGHLVNISLTDSLIIKSRPCIKITFNESDGND